LHHITSALSRQYLKHFKGQVEVQIIIYTAMSSDYAQQVELTTEDAQMYNCPTCIHSGICKQYLSTGDYFCECPSTDHSGFFGLTCETSYLDCNDDDKRTWRCLNGGQCRKDDGECACPNGFIGRHCETCVSSHCSLLADTTAVGMKSNRDGTIIGITFGCLLGSVALFLLGFKLGRNRGLAISRGIISTHHDEETFQNDGDEELHCQKDSSELT